MKSKGPNTVVGLMLLCCITIGYPQQASALTPPAAVRDLAAWYDASDNTTLTSSPYISQWNDKSGNGYNLTQATAGLQPVLTTIGANQAVLFSGGQRLDSSTTNTFATGSNPSAMFVVGAWTGASTATYAGAASYGMIGTTFTRLVGRKSGSYAGYASEWNADSNSTGVWASTPTLGEGLFGAATETVYMNGAGMVNSSQVPATPAGTLFRIGNSPNNGGAWTGPIYEVVVYNADLTTLQRQLIEGVLACKWGLQSSLPVAHPYYAVCPTGTESTNLTSITGLTGWYDANDTSTITQRSYVSQMTDKSSNGLTLTQATASKQPYITTVGVNQALQFSGAGSLSSSTSNMLVTGSNPSTMFAVAGTGTASVGAFGYGTTTTATNRSISSKTGAKYVQATESNQDANSSTVWSTTLMMASAIFGSTTESVAANGGALTSAAAVPNTAAGTALNLGAQTPASNFWNGPIYEALAYNHALTTVEQQFIEGYLACKWGLQASLPAAHPYRSTCPATATSNLTLVQTVSPTGPQVPGTSLSYTTTFTNSSGTIIYDPLISVAIPTHTSFVYGSAADSLGGTGLTVVISYSNNNGSTYAYTPVNSGGIDPAVTNIRWVFTGALGAVSSINNGTVTYAAKIQ